MRYKYSLTKVVMVVPTSYWIRMHLALPKITTGRAVSIRTQLTDPDRPRILIATSAIVPNKGKEELGLDLSAEYKDH